jgi:rhomboid protease GluP
MGMFAIRKTYFMLNEPPHDQNRPVHPLEQHPEPEAYSPQEPVRQRRPHPLELRPAAPEEGTRPSSSQAHLHIPSVTPNVTYVLVAVNVGIFALMALFQDFGLNLLNWGANEPEAVLRNGEYYRLLTAMFLHGSVPHILFNGLVLYSFGTSLERIMGHARFAAIYFLGGLGGSVASVVLGSAHNVPSVGASGAIFAIIGAEYVFLYQHRKLLGASGESRRRSLLMMGLMNLVFGIATSLGNGPVRIDNWGHIGGLIGGLALAWFINPIYLLKRHPDYTDDTHFMAVDVNPFNKKYWVLSIYSAALLAILIVAVALVR